MNSPHPISNPTGPRTMDHRPSAALYTPHDAPDRFDLAVARAEEQLRQREPIASRAKPLPAWAQPPQSTRSPEPDRLAGQRAYQPRDWTSPRSRRRNQLAAARRDRLRALEICINSGVRDAQDPASVHGKPVTPGGKCQHCVDVHKKTKSSGT